MKIFLRICFLAGLVLFMSSCENTSSNIGVNNSDLLYRVVIDITPYFFADANGHVYDSNNLFIDNAKLKIDDTILVKQESDTYYANLGSIWTDGSSHTYSIETPDGLNTSGTIIAPEGLLSGLIYNPIKGVIAKSYTITPPDGIWPSNSFIYCIAVVGTTNWKYSKRPTGTEPVIFEYDNFLNATAINFYSSIKMFYTIDGYKNGSVISVGGIETKW